MKNYTDEEIDFINENYQKLTYSQMEEKLGKRKGEIRADAKFIVKNFCKKGKNKLSHVSGGPRKYNCDDNFFKRNDTISNYWAGFLAADGYLIKTQEHHRIKLVLAVKDKKHLETFKKDLNLESPIAIYDIKYKYKEVSTIKQSCSICFTSKSIFEDLNNLYKITNKKSLTLEFPNLLDEKLIDSFIKGYLDGDGCISLLTPKKHQNRKTFTISVLGTEEVLTSIQKRFSQILGVTVNKPCKRNNIYILEMQAKRARKIFLHYYNIDPPGLKRKWSEEIYNYCFYWKNFKNIKKYKLVFDLTQEGKTIMEISEIMNLSADSIYWYRRQPIYKSFS